jgi:RNA polymerase sigma factor (sigma-70 family)
MTQEDVGEYQHAIKSRAKMLSGRYNMPYEDLVQEGLETVVKVCSKHKDVNKKYLFKAINNWFSYIERKANQNRKLFSTISLDDLIETPSDRSEIEIEAIEHRIDLERVGSKLPEVPQLICELIIHGCTLPEIAEALNMSYEGVSKHVRTIKRCLND